LDIGDGQIVADFGCGLGHAAIEFARRVGPSGHVHALDVNAEFIDGLSLVYDHSP
jgi:ubiquinone/menaquinone biosynthesis C-methylase UbiE